MSEEIVKKTRKGSTIKKEELTPEVVKKKRIDVSRRMARAVRDDEQFGERGYLLASETPLNVFVDPDNKYNPLGGLSSSNISSQLTDIEKNMTGRLTRYKQLESALRHPEMKGVITIHANETLTEDLYGEVMHIQHPKAEFQEIVERCFERIRLYDKLWNIAHDMYGYGDDFWEIIPAADLSKILRFQWIPRNSIEVIEENGVLKGYKPISVETNKWTGAKTYKTSSKEEDIIEPWRIAHFKLPSTLYDPYGESVIDTVVTLIEELKLMERSLIIARVTRAPERRVYNINVGQLQAEKAVKYAQDVVAAHKIKKRLNISGEKLDLMAEALGASEDIIIPRRQGDEPSTIDVLPAAANLSEVGDLEFLRDKIFPGVTVPRQYLYDDTFANANTNLSNKSVVFSKKAKRGQKALIYVAYKIAYIELKLAGASNKDIEDLKITMNDPSNISVRERVETLTNVWTLISTIKGITTTDGQPFLPDYLLYRDILDLEADQIKEIYELNQLQKQFSENANGEANGEGGEGDMAGGDISAPSGDTGNAEPAPEGGVEPEGETPAQDAIMNDAAKALGGKPLDAETASMLPDKTKSKAYLEAEYLKKQLFLLAESQNKQAQENANKTFAKKHKGIIESMEIGCEFKGLDFIMEECKRAVLENQDTYKDKKRRK